MVRASCSHHDDVLQEHVGHLEQSVVRETDLNFIQKRLNIFCDWHFAYWWTSNIGDSVYTRQQHLNQMTQGKFLSPLRKGWPLFQIGCTNNSNDWVYELETHPWLPGLGKTGDVKQKIYINQTNFDLEDHVETILRTSWQLSTRGIMDTMPACDTM